MKQIIGILLLLNAAHIFSMQEVVPALEEENFLEQDHGCNIHDQLSSKLAEAGITQNIDQIRKIITQETQKKIKKKHSKALCNRCACFTLGITSGAVLALIIWTVLKITL